MSEASQDIPDLQQAEEAVRQLWPPLQDPVHVHEMRMRCIEAAVKCWLAPHTKGATTSGVLKTARQFTDYVLGPLPQHPERVYVPPEERLPIDAPDAG